MEGVCACSAKSMPVGSLVNWPHFVGAFVHSCRFWCRNLVEVWRRTVAYARNLYKIAAKQNIIITAEIYIQIHSVGLETGYMQIFYPPAIFPYRIGTPRCCIYIYNILKKNQIPPSISAALFALFWWALILSQTSGSQLYIFFGCLNLVT